MQFDFQLHEVTNHIQGQVMVLATQISEIWYVMQEQIHISHFINQRREKSIHTKNNINFGSTKCCARCRARNSSLVDLMKCEKCLAVRYCSSECQEEDRTQHKLMECQPKRSCRWCGIWKSYVSHLARCGRCPNVGYCSVVCQWEDWECQDC